MSNLQADNMPEDTLFGRHVAATTAGNQASQWQTVKLIISFVFVIILVLFFLPEQKPEQGKTDGVNSTSMFNEWGTGGPRR